MPLLYVLGLQEEQDEVVVYNDIHDMTNYIIVGKEDAYRYKVKVWNYKYDGNQVILYLFLYKKCWSIDN